MFNATKSYSEKKPEVIQYLGNNKYHYNYDIQEEEQEVEGETKIVYSYIPVKVVNKPDYKRCVKAVIRKYVDIDEEFDLINTYMNQLMSGVTTLSTSDNEYKDYMNLLSEIKKKVNDDFNK